MKVVPRLMQLLGVGRLLEVRDEDDGSLARDHVQRCAHRKVGELAQEAEAVNLGFEFRSGGE